MISEDEAVLIVKGWLDNQSELLLSARMANFSMVSKCRVYAVEGGMVTLWPLEGDAASFSFSLSREHLELNYSSLREFKDSRGMETTPAEKLDHGALVISLPLKAIDPAISRSMNMETIILQEF